MAADAAPALAGLEIDGAAHALHGASLRVHGLEGQGLEGGRAEPGGAVRLDGDGAQQHARRLGVGVADAGLVGHVGLAFGEDLEHAQFSDPAPVGEGEVAVTDVGQEELAVAAVCVKHAGQDGRHGPGRGGDGVHAGDAGGAVKQFEVAEAVEEVQPRFGVFLGVGTHAGEGIKAETDEEVVFGEGPGAVEIGVGPLVASLGVADLRGEGFDGGKVVLAAFAVKPGAGRIKEHERAAHVGVVRPGEKGEAVCAGDGMGLVAGVDALGVVAEELARVRAVGVRHPDAVEMGRRAVHIVPAGVGDAPVVEHLRVPLAGLVDGQGADRAVRLKAVQGVGGQRLPGVVAAGEAAPACGHEGDAAVGQGAGIEIVVRAVREGAQVAAVNVHRVKVEAAPFGRVEVRLFAVRGARGKGKVEGLRIMGHGQGGIVALGQAALDQFARIGRLTGLVENVNAAARDVGVVVVVAEVFVEHLADEAVALHEGDGASGEERVFQGDAAGEMAQFQIERQPLLFVQITGPRRAHGEIRQGFPGRRNRRRRRQVRNQQVRPAQCRRQRLGAVRVAAQPRLLAAPVRLDGVAPCVFIGGGVQAGGGDDEEQQGGVIACVHPLCLLGLLPLW